MVDDARVRIESQPEGGALVRLPYVDYLDTQAGPVEVGLDHDLLVQLHEALSAHLGDPPMLRHCLYPSCLREFDAMATMAGREPMRPSWSGKGWLQARQLDGYVCPDHAPALAADAHLPQWDHSGGTSTLECACGWLSVPVRWRRYATEAWKDHLL